MRWRHDRALAAAHSFDLDHDIGVADWFIALATDAHLPATLTAWWSPPQCARLWGDRARPDCYGRLDPTPPTADGTAGLEFSLEYDCGTASLTQLTK